MTVNFNQAQAVSVPKAFNNLGFDPVVPPSIPVNAPVVEAAKTDGFVQASTPTSQDVVPEEKGEKKGPVRALKDFIRAAKKLGITISEYTKGTFKGIIQGAAVGAGIFTAGSAYKGIKNLMKKPSKMPVKALAIAGAIVTVGVNYWKTSLNANEKKADVDHRYTTTKAIDRK